MKKFWLLAIFLTLMSLFGVQAKTQAQLILVSEEYRVVVVDRAQQRIGIANCDANPDVRQNWVYLKDKTEILHRRWNDEGAFRDEKLDWDHFFRTVRKGNRLWVHGGRDWDGSIDAKKIWF
ncbi:hypothetical protein IJT10_02075 [bacterium]|nr:hypothetical protein [bacterium]